MCNRACRGRPPITLSVSDDDRRELSRRVRALTSTQRSAARARIILECERGDSAQTVAVRLGMSRSKVERWRGRYAKKGLAGLEDLPRPGHARKFSPVEIVRLIALACEPPGEREQQDGRARRTLEEMRDEAIRREIVPGIAKSSVGRILNDVDVKPYLVREWIHSPDPQFGEKVTEITDLYLNRPDDSVVLSIDEKTGIQALERGYPDRAAAPGRPRRQDFEYKRHGTQSLICALNVHSGSVLGRCGDRRTGQDLVDFLEEVAVEYPTGTVHVIWDNLNTHYDGPGERWSLFNARHGDRFVFHYTPIHASWVNQIELFFSIVERLCLRRKSFRSKQELRETILAFLDYWNRERAHPFRWTFTGYPLQSGVPELKHAA